LKVLLDVDVILDVLARRNPFFADAASVLAACELGRCRGLVAAHSVTTLHYLLRKYRGEVQARGSLADLLRILRVATVNAKVIQQALTSDSPDFEDAVQMAAAVAARADHVVTRNLRHFSASPVPALQPAELLPLLPR
jgi:predicted nucleic acid-binding protein